MHIYFIYITQIRICSGLISQTSHAAVDTISLFLWSAWWWLFISQNM